MVDTVTTQILEDGPKWAVIKFTNVSDGTGEAAVEKVVPNQLSGNPRRLAISEIDYSTYGMMVRIMWDAATDVVAFTTPADSMGNHCFDNPLVPDPAAGSAYKILFTTIGHTSGDTYSITLKIKKKYD